MALMQEGATAWERMSGSARWGQLWSRNDEGVRQWCLKEKRHDETEHAQSQSEQARHVTRKALVGGGAAAAAGAPEINEAEVLAVHWDWGDASCTLHRQVIGSL